MSSLFKKNHSTPEGISHIREGRDNLTLYSGAALEGVRRACQVAALVLERTCDAVTPGMSTLDLDRLAFEEGDGVLRSLTQFQRRLDAEIAMQQVDDAGHEIVVAREFGKDKVVLVLGREFPVEEIEAGDGEEARHDIEFALAPRFDARILAYEV